MAKLEDLKRNAQVKGLIPSGVVTILNVQQHGSDVFEVTYRDINGKDSSELLFRDRESDLEVTEAGTPWAFDSDGELFRLASEAYRIRMAYLFDPWMAVHLSQVEPLPVLATYSSVRFLGVFGWNFARRFLLTVQGELSRKILPILLLPGNYEVRVK